MLSKSAIARGVAAFAAVAALVSAGAASAANRYVLVINNTDHTLERLYAAGRDYPGGFTDWLGRRTLAPGQSMVIDFSDGSGDCRMTVVGKFSDGDTVSEDSFNVCSEARMVFRGD